MVLMESLSLPMGSPIIDFSLKGIDGRVYSLNDFADAQSIVVVFMCNHCPYVQAVWSRLVALQEKYKNDGVQFVGINANINPKYEEDSFENMKKYFEMYKMNFPYLADEGQNVAREYQAQCTPDIYVFDAGRKLAYHGRLDDSWKDESKVTKKELDQAIGLILAGKKIEEKQNPSMGCSIKWVES
ncbi:MAG: thioredoxin family protein [Patescibacteria group bacterium]